VGKEVNVTVNGEAREVDDGATIGSIVDSITHDRTRVAVERNLEIVPRATYDEAGVADGDVVEVVTLVGGG